MEVLRAWFAATMALVLLVCAPALAWSTSMQLLTPDKGWTVSGGRLFWTADNGGHWNDITPDVTGQISDVFFLDASLGWVLFESGDEESNMISFHLASTTDSGQSWTIRPINVHGQEPDQLGGSGWLDFVDPLHGWIALQVKSSSAFSWEILLLTDNGGKSWKELPQPPFAGRPVFATAQEGWISGPAWAGGLCGTLDGGKTWQGNGPSLQDLPPSLPTQPSYGDVKFTDAKHGAVPIWLQPSNDAEESRGTALVLYVTDDGGRTWKRERTLTDRGAFSKYGGALSRIGGNGLVADPSRVGSSLVVGFNDRKHLNRLTLMTVRRGESTTDAAPSVSSENVLWRHGDDVVGLSFSTSAQGWARTALGDLLLTMDGGVTWKNIGPTRPPVAPAH